MSRGEAAQELRCNLLDQRPPPGWVLVSEAGLRRLLDQFPDHPA